MKRPPKGHQGIALEDRPLLEQAAELLDSTVPPLLAQRELIMEVLRSLLDTRYAKQRIKLVLTPPPTTALEGRLADRIAAVVAQTYAELGDAAGLADDEALELIRELLLGFDAEIIDRNRFRKLRRWPWGES
jgi:hypothetical protein